MKKIKKFTSKLLALAICFAILFTVIQIPLTATAAELTNLLSNGTFDTNVVGWKNSNSGWGTLGWDEAGQFLTFTKTSASSGPQIYSEVIAVTSGETLDFSYDYKTSAALSGVATSVYIYAYTSETVASKGSTHFTPSGNEYYYEFVDTKTDWQTKSFEYTVPDGYSYVQVVFGFRGAVAANTVLSIDNVGLYRSITEENGPESLLPNGTFDSDVVGWKNSNSSWGTLGWDETAQALTFKKVSASSGPAVYSEAVKTAKGGRVHLSYDYKTNVALSGVATTVYVYAYTADLVSSKGTTLFTPTGSNNKGEFVDTKTDWQTKELMYTLPEDCEYIQVQIAFRGAVAANTVLTVDNISLYDINEDYVLSKITDAVQGDDATLFGKWIADEALAIENLDSTKYLDYFEALKEKDEITKDVVQEVVNSFISNEPKSLLSNGTFDTGVVGWKCSNTSWGTLAWDNTNNALSFTKVSASSGPSVYSPAIKVNGGDTVYLKYDFKTSAALKNTATAVYLYGYTSTDIENKGSLVFNPSGNNYTYEFVDTTTDWQTNDIFYTLPDDCEYVQVVFGFRGAVAANTVWTLDNVYLYNVDADYIVYQIEKAIENDNLSDFNLWIRKEALGIASLDPDKFENYFEALKKKAEISKEVIQAVVDSLVVEGAPISMLPNGSFAADVSGWNVTNSAWGTLNWDSSQKAASFKKLAISSGPSIYTDLIKVDAGSKLCLNYDFKTSVPLTGNSTVVQIYAYTKDFVDSKGTNVFNPTGSNYLSEFADSTTEWQKNELTYTIPADCEYVQVVIGFRGAATAETVLSVDNVKLYNIDADFVLYKLSEAITQRNRFATEDWLKESILGIQNVSTQNRKAYYEKLVTVTERLTKEKVQQAVNAVNTENENATILENGSFDTSVLPWRAFNATSPSASYSAIDGGCASLTKERDLNSIMLSQVVDVAYGDIIHLEFTAKANTKTELTTTISQFTKDELITFGDDAAQEGKEAASKENQVFVLTGEPQKFVVDITISKSIYGLVVAFAQNGTNLGDTVYIDNVTLNRGTAEFVNNKLNSAIIEGDVESFARWMKHTNSGLTHEIITADAQLLTLLKSEREKKGTNLTAKEMQIASANRVTDIGTRLELFVDDTLIDKQNTTADLEVVAPEFAGQILDCSGGFVCDNIANQVYTGHFDPSRITEDTRPWETLGSSGACVVKVGDKFYCYYRGVDDEVQTVDRYVNGYGNHDPSVAYYLNVCVAISDDGKTWVRPEYDFYDFEYQGENLRNNIIIGDIMKNFDGGTKGGRHLCSFAVIKDDGPNGNPEKPYKAMMVLTMQRGWGFDLFALESADGIKWDVMNNGEPVISNGRNDIMDSENVITWSETDQEYKLYFRMWIDHPEYGEQRAIAVIGSKDFINWEDIDTESVIVDYYSDKTDQELTVRNEGLNGNHPDGYQFYTNSIQTYDRAPHIYLGMPTRYLGNKAIEVAPYLAAGRDGVNFKLWDTKLIEPSPELGRDGNRSNYADYPLYRTSETEYSFLAHRGFKNSGMIYDRFTFRVDGFVAAKGDAAGKFIVTTPITFNGDSLILNYKAPEGTVRAQLTDVDGNPLQGFTYADCTALTGDSIEQELVWTGDLSTITEPVKISFELVNAELYSYKFDCTEHEFDSVCDADCNVDGCDYVRTPAEHKYSNACDATCDNEGCTAADRQVPAHVYSHKADIDCNECGAPRTIVGNHLIKEGDKYVYYVDGVKSNITELVKIEGEWLYIENGVWATTVDTLHKINGKWFLIKQGKWKATTGLVQYKGKTFYVKGGKWNSDINDLIKISGKWYFIKSGKWDKTLESLHKINGKWFLIKGGMWSATTGIVKYKGKDFYVKGGKWSSSVNTLYKKGGKYYAIKSGKWYKSKAIIKYSGKKYYCNKGYAQLKYSGKVKVGSKTYTIKKGIVK